MRKRSWNYWNTSMKKIGLLLCSLFLFASFSSESKQEAFDLVGKWTVEEPKGMWKEFIFYEGHYVKMIPLVKQPNRIEGKNYSYSVNWENDPYILVVELYKTDESNTDGENKLPFALKIIDDNHILIALDRGGTIRASSFTKNETMALTRQ